MAVQKLGRYSVVSSHAGESPSVQMGGGTEGAQPDFSNAVDALVLSSKNLVHIRKDGRGYASKKELDDWAGYSDDWKKYSRYYGNGLAIQIDPTEGNSRKVVTAFLDKNCPKYGLSYFKQNENTKLAEATNTATRKSTYVLIPASIKWKSGKAASVKYLGKKVKGKADSAAGGASSDSDSDSDSGSSSSSGTGSASVNSTAFFFSNQFGSVQQQLSAEMLTGERAIANDEPLFGSVKEACQSGLRSFCSDQTGKFVAWYPDYWCVSGANAPQFDLKPIELVNLTITQSDDSFYSHVFTPGVDVMGNQLSMGGDSNMKYMLTQGVVSIESEAAATMSVVNSQAKRKSKPKTKTAKGRKSSTSEQPSDKVSSILKDMINIPEGSEWKYTPRELYRRYGARPYRGSAGNLIEMITDNQEHGAASATENDDQKPKSSKTDGKGKKNKSKAKNKSKSKSSKSSSSPKYIMPFLMALNTFMEKWSEQFTVTIQTTFNPKIFPGIRINVLGLPKGKTLSVYVDSVSHNMSYETGFTTTLTTKCPMGTLIPGLPRIKKGK